MMLLPIAKPEVTVKQLTPNHEFIVLACDGKDMVWVWLCYAHDHRNMGCDEK